MKHMRKLMALLLVVIMIMAMGVTAFATNEDLDSDNSKYTIKIQDGVNGQTYTAYKVFDVTLASAEGNANNSGFSYTISSSSNWWSTIRGTQDPTTKVWTNTSYGLTFTPIENSTTYIVGGNMTESQAAALAAALAADTTKPAAAGTIASYAVGSADTIEVSTLGYYFVDTTVGSLCSLDTTNQDVTINEKNSAPTLNSKEVSFIQPCIGDDITFTIKFTAGNGAQNYVLHDKMEAGFNTASDFTVSYKDGSNAAVPADSSTYTIVTDSITDGCSFHIEFEDAAMVADRVVTVTYKTALNENAEISDGSDNDSAINKNTTWLSYGENENMATVEKSVNVKTYAIAINKTDGEGNPLAGAKFKFERPLVDNITYTPVYFSKSADGVVYTYAGTEPAAGLTSELVSPAGGVIIIKGVYESYHRLTETEAPDGYNALTESISVRPSVNWTTSPSTKHYVVYSNNTATEVTPGADPNEKEISTSVPTHMLNIVNQTGTELPSTGGMGTTLFYILGGLMVVVALVVLVTNKRMRRT